jgi:hypothetical protein
LKDVFDEMQTYLRNGLEMISINRIKWTMVCKSNIIKEKQYIEREAWVERQKTIKGFLRAVQKTPKKSNPWSSTHTIFKG